MGQCYRYKQKRKRKAAYHKRRKDRLAAVIKATKGAKK